MFLYISVDAVIYAAHPSTVLLEKQSNLTTDWELASGLVTIKCNADIAGVPSDVKKIHRLQISKLFVFYGVSFAFKIATITADQEKIDFPVRWPVSFLSLHFCEKNL